jgi:glutaredoxin
VTSAARPNGLILITTEDCHFCRRAHEVLEALAVAAREIDVDSDEATALAAHGIPLAFMPVLTDGQRVVAYGRLSEKRLRKELAL